MVPTGNKAKRLSSFNHTTKTINHQHHHNHHHHHHHYRVNCSWGDILIKVKHVSVISTLILGLGVALSVHEIILISRCIENDDHQP